MPKYFGSWQEEVGMWRTLSESDQEVVEVQLSAGLEEPVAASAGQLDIVLDQVAQ